MKKLLYLLFIPLMAFSQKSNSIKKDSISNFEKFKIEREKSRFSLGYDFEFITLKIDELASSLNNYPKRYSINVLNLQYSVLESDSPIQISALASLRQNDYRINSLNESLVFNFAFGMNLGYNLPFNVDLVVDVLFRPKSLDIYKFLINLDKSPVILKPSLEFGESISIKLGYFKEFSSNAYSYSNFYNILDASGIFCGLKYKF